MYVFKEGRSYIVYSPALDMSSYGDTEDDAKTAFVDVVESSFKYSLNKNTLKEDLQKRGWKIKSLKQRKIKSPSFDEMLENNECFRDILQKKEYRKYQQHIGLPEIA